MIDASMLASMLCPTAHSLQIDLIMQSAILVTCNSGTNALQAMSSCIRCSMHAFVAMNHMQLPGNTLAHCADVGLTDSGRACNQWRQTTPHGAGSWWVVWREG
jgi:hypothetical protein